jgi:hypothetical protein
MCTGQSLFSSPEPKGLIALAMSAFHSVLLFSNTAPILPHIHIPAAPRDPFLVPLIPVFIASTPRFAFNNGSGKRDPHS